MPKPQFMAPLVDWLVGVLTNADLGELAAFAEVKRSWTGVVTNWPPAAVLPGKSEFDAEMTGASHSDNSLRVKFGVEGGDPDQLTVDAMAYMAAIDAAIEAAGLPPNGARVFVQSHDYGPLYGNNGSLAYFP